MAVVSMKQLLEAGVHFGHQTRRWNPKMATYIYTERNGIYIIDLQKTVKKLEEAYFFVRDLAAQGGSILFVGTKKQAQEAMKEEAEKVGMYYVNARWLGGMLTNFKTMRKRVERLNQLNRMSEDGTFDLLPKKEVIKLKLEIEKLKAEVKTLKAMLEPPENKQDDGFIAALADNNDWEDYKQEAADAEDKPDEADDGSPV